MWKNLFNKQIKSRLNNGSFLTNFKSFVWCSFYESVMSGERNERCQVFGRINKTLAIEDISARGRFETDFMEINCPWSNWNFFLTENFFLQDAPIHDRLCVMICNAVLRSKHLFKTTSLLKILILLKLSGTNKILLKDIDVLCQEILRVIMLYISGNLL